MFEIQAIMKNMKKEYQRDSFPEQESTKQYKRDDSENIMGWSLMNIFISPHNSQCDKKGENLDDGSDVHNMNNYLRIDSITIHNQLGIQNIIKYT